MIYFDNSSTTLKKPETVAKAVFNAINNHGNSSRSFHQAAKNANLSIYNCRENIRKIFNVKSEEKVIFTNNATSALNMAINSIDGHIITTNCEHNSVLRPVYRKNNYTIVNSNINCEFDYNEFENSIKKNTKAIIINHGNNVCGNVYNLEKIGQICKKNNLLFIVDASQTAGYIPIDMESMQIDGLCFTGHKSLYGVQGTGGICLSEKFTPIANIVGGSGHSTFNVNQPTQLPDYLEAGTQNSHGISGLNEGVKYILEKGINNIYKETNKLTNELYNLIKGNKSIHFYGNIETNEYRCPIIAFNILDYDSADIAYILWDKYNIATRSGAHCAPLVHENLGTKEQGIVRLSLSHFNSYEEVVFAGKAINELILSLES